MRNMNHEEFEKNVMNMLLEGSDQKLSILREQYLSSNVTNRDFTGRGFFTRFIISDDLVKYSFNGKIEDLQASITDNEGHCLKGDYLFFILYVTNGKLDTLECFTTLDGVWDYNYDNITKLEYCYEHRKYELI